MARRRHVAEIGRVKKMRKVPWDLMSDWRRAISIIGPRTKAKTMGRFQGELLHQVTDHSEYEHDGHIRGAVVDGIRPDQAEKDNEREKNRVRNFQELDPHPDQGEIQGQKHSVAYVHTDHNSPEELRMLRKKKRPRGYTVDDQRAQQHCHDHVGRDSKGQQGDEGSLGRSIICRFGAATPSIIPLPKPSGFLDTRFSIA